MLKVALRGVFVRKLRAFLTAVAVFLGVALVAGTYVLTDTFNNSFGEIFEETNLGTDVAVVPREAVRTQAAGPPPMPAELVDRVRGVEGVDEAVGGIFSVGVTMFDEDGERIGTTNAPAFGASAQPERFEALNYVEGGPPRTERQVAVDALTAEREDFEVGDTVRVGGATGAGDYEITGIGRLGDVDSFGGATVAVFVTEEVQRLAGKEGEFDQISVAAEEGVSREELKRRVRAVMPEDVEVRTGEENAAEMTANIEEDLGFLQTALLVFAGIALFVGAFTIFNTFSITVAQRAREFGMLRTLGASRRQVLGTVMAEALSIGVVASALGVLAGLGVANLLNALFKAVEIDLPNTGNVVETRTIVVSLTVGIGVTLVAAAVPAVRATRVSPIEALRDQPSIPTRGRRRVVTAVALLVTAGGIGLMSVGLFGGIDSSGQAAGLLGFGAALLFLGTALLSPRLVRPLASAVGRPLELLRGLTGRLARENSTRNPGRTATTAAALMIGLALVTFVTVFAAGITASIDDAIDRSFVGDYTLQHEDGFSYIPAAAGDALREVEGVAAVSSLRWTEGELEETGGERTFLTSVNPPDVEQVLDLQWEQGSDETLRTMGRDDALVDDAWASGNDLGVGDTLSVTTPVGDEVTYTIRGSIEDTADLYGDFVLTHEAMREDFRMRQDSLAFVRLDAAADQAAVRERLETVVERDFPVAELLDQQELKDRTAEQINQLLGLLYALLSLAVIVSLFGIVNTLTLSIYERTRELGLLRAVGMSRRQVRRIVRYEAVITALIGAALGSVLGIFFAVIVSRPLADEGFTLSFPVPTLVVLMVLAAVAGVLAAILPARRAARLDVLEALAYE